jgi:cytosine/adenosine deaminase-related metal-dependent hydrolase
MAYTAKTFDVTAREVLEMATTAGADAVGLDRGVIEPGKRAALVVLDGDSDNLAGVEDPIRAVVRRATAIDVKDVLL